MVQSESLVERNLQKIGIVLPDENLPGGEYLSFKKSGNLIYISGQTCKIQGKVAYAGKAGREFGIEQAQEAAQICAINVLVQLKHACEGNLDKVKSCMKVNIFVNCVEEFREHAKVANGFSNVIITAFGENGRHTRTTVGCSSLPSQSLVEADGIFEIEFL